MLRPRSWFARLFRPVSVARRLEQERPRYQPQLETLEDRLAPASFLVTTTLDGGPGSLRAAVDAANAAGGANTITIGPAVAGKTITALAHDTNNPFAFGPTAFAIGTPTKADFLTIQGDPTSGLVISGGGSQRIFGIFGTPASTLTVMNVTLAGGFVQGGNGGGRTGHDDIGGGGGAGLGGAIFVAGGGTLNVVQSLLTGNTATGGVGGYSGRNDGTRSGEGGGGSAAYAGGNPNVGPGGTYAATGSGGGGVGGPGQSNVGFVGGLGGANEFGAAALGGPYNTSGSAGTSGGGGGGAGGKDNQGGNSGGSGANLSSGGFGGGGGGSWGNPGTSIGGFGAGGGGMFWGRSYGGFGGGAGAQWGGPVGTPGFGGGAPGHGGTNSWGSGGGGGAGMGGAIFNNGGTVNITNSTLYGNSATGGAGGAGGDNSRGAPYISQSGTGGSAFGGAIFNRNGTITIRNSTFSQNTVTAGAAGAVIAGGTSGAAGLAGGGGIYNLSDGAGGVAKLLLNNSIVSGSVGASDIGNNRNNAGAGSAATVTATTPNILQTAVVNQNGATSSTTGAIITNPQLSALANNGGPTQTLAETSTSPGIDSGSNAAAAGLTVDERGFSRIVNGIVDIGAYEFQGPTPTTIIVGTSATPINFGSAVTFTATVTGSGLGSNVPSGTVTFVVDGQPVATVQTVNGVATFTTTALAPGTHSVVAVFNGGMLGNIAFNPSTSAAIQEVVNPPPPPLPPPPVKIYAVGTDAGPAAEVNVYDATTGALKYVFFPFGNFTGGVRVAVGDINGDGAPDIICGAGPGALPQVNVYDGRTGALIEFFFAFSPATANGIGSSGTPSALGFSGPLFHGGVFVAAGDILGRGYADIIVGADAGTSPQIQVFDGKSGALVANFFAFGTPFFTGGVRVAAGDLYGLGRADIIVAAGRGGGPQVQVYDGLTLLPIANFYAFGTPFFTGGLFASAGDLYGLGHAELIVGAGGGGGPQVQVYDVPTQTVLANFFAYTPTFGGGVRVGTDVIGDNGHASLLTGVGRGVPSLVLSYDAGTIGLLNAFFAFGPLATGGVFVS